VTYSQFADRMVNPAQRRQWLADTLNDRRLLLLFTAHVVRLTAALLKGFTSERRLVVEIETWLWRCADGDKKIEHSRLAARLHRDAVAMRDSPYEIPWVGDIMRNVFGVVDAVRDGDYDYAASAAARLHGLSESLVFARPRGSSVALRGFRGQGLRAYLLWGMVMPIHTWHPDWTTSHVLALAEPIYRTESLQSCPILADAVQEAGCTDPVILANLRGADARDIFRGCWILDKATGRR